MPTTFPAEILTEEVCHHSTVGTPVRETAGIRIPTGIPVRKVYSPLNLPIESISYIFNLKLLTFEIINDKYNSV